MFIINGILVKIHSFPFMKLCLKGTQLQASLRTVEVRALLTIGLWRIHEHPEICPGRMPLSSDSKRVAGTVKSHAHPGGSENGVASLSLVTLPTL